MHITSTPSFAAMGLGVPEVFIMIMALGLLFAVPLVVIAFVLHNRNRDRKLWHDTARLALERGQPIPPAAVDPTPRLGANQEASRNDVRTGLIMMGAGIGLAIFLRTVGATEATGIGAIPGFVGLALLISGLFLPPKSEPRDRPPQP